MSEQQSTHGTIWAVFGHRLAIEGAEGRVLVDLGPEGARGLTLTPGDSIAVTGERKASGIKAASITLPDGTQRTIPWAKPPHHGAGDHKPADPARALSALRNAGYEVAGEPRRKPKHYEIRATRAGHVFDTHVTLDGTIRKANPVPPGAP